MKSLFVLLFSLVSLTTFASDTKELATMLSITDNLIETVNSNSKPTYPLNYFDDDPCYYRTGTIQCKAPCNNGSSFSTGCHNNDEAAGVEMAALASDICGNCGAIIDYEVGCED